MNKLIIKNGLVYDPLYKIEGEKKDILVESGKIVDKFSNEKDIKEIDANGKTVIPSAIDIHTHVASLQVNWMRLLGSNNDMFTEIWHGLTLENISRNYISMGYTFILEANVFPSLAKQTIFNFQHLPVLDKGMLLNISNLWPLELEFQRGKIDEMAVFLSDLLSKTKGFGFKVYNPFECEMWNLKELRQDISSQGRLYNFSALDVYENVVKCVESLGLPHSAHAHIEGYENSIGKENLFKVLEKIKSINLDPSLGSNSKTKRNQILHLAHANSYSSDGDSNNLINFLNEDQRFSADLSFVGFNQINPIITSDRRLINSMYTIDSLDNPYKLISSAVEFEGDFFISLRTLKKSNYKDCALWANALELALNVRNKYQISFSLNFPNYANIIDIPDIFTWLVSKEARDKYMKGMNQEFTKNNHLVTNDKTLDFSELICITRASPAKLLGLDTIKGNLNIGADADINIIDINTDDIDISKDYNVVKKAFSNIVYTIKAGSIIKKDDSLDLSELGSIFWSNGKESLKEGELTIAKKKEFYQKYGSLFYDSYNVSIDNKYLRRIK